MSRNPVHLLYPHKVCHKPAEIVRLLQAGFAFVQTDAVKAARHIEGLIDAFSAPKIKEQHRKLLCKSLQITVSEREDLQDDYICFVAMPGVAPGIFYASEAHRDATASIVERVAKVLNYKAIPAYWPRPLRAA